jgi:hypothetical protein
MFLWFFIWWAMLPFQAMVIRSVPDEPALTQALQSGIPESGVYFLPFTGMSTVTPDEQAAFLERHRQGPLAQIFYRRDGVNITDGSIIFMGLAHCLVTALLLGVVLRHSAGALPGYGQRVRFCTLVGALAAVCCDLIHPVWFHHQWSWWLVMALYHVTSCLVAGMVLGALVRPDQPQAPAPLSPA